MIDKTLKTRIGSTGEKIACEFLKNKKFVIITRNYRTKRGEIDIVARSKNGALVFVEVKTFLENRTVHKFQEERLKPEDNITSKKLKKLSLLAYEYALSHENLINDEAGWQIDFIGITIYNDASSPLTINNKNCLIRHFENIVP